MSAFCKDRKLKKRSKIFPSSKFSPRLRCHGWSCLWNEIKLASIASIMRLKRFPLRTSIAVHKASFAAATTFHPHPSVRTIHICHSVDCDAERCWISVYLDICPLHRPIRNLYGVSLFEIFSTSSVKSPFPVRRSESQVAIIREKFVDKVAIKKNLSCTFLEFDCRQFSQRKIGVFGEKKFDFFRLSAIRILLQKSGFFGPLVHFLGKYHFC